MLCQSILASLSKLAGRECHRVRRRHPGAIADLGSPPPNAASRSRPGFQTHGCSSLGPMRSPTLLFHRGAFIETAVLNGGVVCGEKLCNFVENRRNRRISGVLRRCFKITLRRERDAVEPRLDRVAR